MTTSAELRPWRTHDDLLGAFAAAPIVPTVLPVAQDRLTTYVGALAEEGYPIVEMLCRPAERALPLIEQMFATPLRGAVRWGVGTIRTAEIARRAAALEPDFLVSPAFSRRVLDAAADAGIPYVPGVHTFQDVQDVLDAFEDHGLTVRVLKLCPVYGLCDDYIGSLCGCFPGIHFCPTGEMYLHNYVRWKHMPGILAPMGSKLVPPEWAEAGDDAAIRQRLRLLRELSASPPGGGSGSI